MSSERPRSPRPGRLFLMGGEGGLLPTWLVAGLWGRGWEFQAVRPRNTSHRGVGLMEWSFLAAESVTAHRVGTQRSAGPLLISEETVLFSSSQWPRLPWSMVSVEIGTFAS